MRHENLIEIDEAIADYARQKELEAFAEEAFDEVVNAAVRCHEGDPEEVWKALTWHAYDPLRVLKALKANHLADAQIDPLTLMETFMEVYDYRYAHHARFAIACIVGHKHMRAVRTRGKRYWMAGVGRD